MFCEYFLFVLHIKCENFENYEDLCKYKKKIFVTVYNV